MGNIFGGGGGNAAEQARQQERLRQLRINSGLGQINSIYGGGQYGTSPVAKWDPNSYMNMYTSGGTRVSDLTLKDPTFSKWAQDRFGKFNDRTGRFQNVPNGGTPYPNTDPVYDAMISHNGGSDLGPTLADAIRRYSRQLQNNGMLFSSTGSSPGFNKDFYNQKQQAYIGYALPQVASQYNQMNQDTAFNLANRGLTQSSAGNMLRGSLEKERQLQTQGIGDAAIQQTNQLRQDIENQRSSLVSQLFASGDPNTAAQGALNTAANFQTPSTYQPLGNLFSNWANMYLAKQYTGSPQTPGGGMGGFNPYGLMSPGAFGQQQQMMPNIVGSSSNVVR